MTTGPDRSRGRGEGSLMSPLLGFRLDPGERRRTSDTALCAGAHVWVRALDDAVSRTGGRPLASELVDAAALGELTADVIAATARSSEQD